MAPKPKVKAKKPGAIHYLFGPGPFASGHSAPPPPVEGSSRSVSEHEGRVHQPGVPSGPRQTYAPTGSSTVAPVAGPPSPATASPKAQPSAPSHVVARQRSLVKQFVTKAYSQKVAKIRKSTPGYELNDRIGKAKSEVSDLRERLLSHPAVTEANSAGKVVSPTGLSKIHRTEIQRHAIEGPKGVAHSKLFGLEPRSLQVGTKGLKELQSSTGVEGSVARTQAKAQAKAHSASEPSTLEDLGYASIGIPGIGIGGDLAKVTELGASAIPKLLAEGGAKQLATSAGAKVAAKGASVKGGLEALSHLPGEAVNALKAAPKAAKGLPDVLRAGAKETPAALRAGAKAAPKYVGSKGLQGGERGAQAFSGIGALGALHKGGVNVPGGAILEGQGKALAKDPGQVLSSTANIAPGLLVSALQIPAAGVASVTSGSTKPLEGAINEQKNFFQHFASTYGGSDVKKIEQATLKEGLLPEVIAAPLAAKGLEKLNAPVSSAVRDFAAGRRAPLTDAEGNVLLHEHGGPVRRGTQRHPNEIKATRHGENNHLRREEARHAGTTEDLVNVEFGHRARDIEKAARKAAGKKAEVRTGLGPKGKDTLNARPTDFIPFLNRAAIDLHNPEAALREINHYHEQFKKLPPTSKYGADPALLTARDAVDYFRAHPEALKDKHLADMLGSYRDMANGKEGLASLSTSERNRYLGVAAAHGITTPEEALPHGARPLTEATDRAGAWKDLEGRDKQIKALASEGNKKRVQAQAFDKNSAKGKQLRRESKAAYAKAKAIKVGREDLHAALKDYKRPWHKSNRNAKRIPYDAALEKEFVDNTKKVIAERGLHPEPAFVPDTSVVARARPDQSATGGQKALPPGPQINEGYVWQHGLQQQGYEHLLGSVNRSVAAHHWYENGRRFRDERHIDYKGSAQHGSKTWAEALRHGVINEKDTVLVPTGVLSRLESSMRGGTPSEYAQASADLTEQAVKANQGVPGTKYEAYPKAAYQEFAAQAQKAPVAQWLRSANMVSSRMMLSTPSFVAAQVVAEALQGVAETNPLRTAQGMLAYSKLDKAQKARISGVAGETGTAIFSPNKMGNALLHDGKPMKDALGFFRRNLFGRSMKSIVSLKWAGEVNRYTSGLTRRAVLTGDVMKELNGLQAHGRKLLGMQDEFQKATEGMTPKQKMAWAADHPQFLDKQQRQLEASMGGWNNLTRTGHFPEVYRAAGLIFYPFQRFSVLWPLKYAKNHPIKATALAYLTAQNNFALREALHGEPSFLNYAQIPIYGTNPKTGKLEATNTINLSRMTPGGNAFVEIMQGTGSPVGALQPALSTPLLAGTGLGTQGEVEGGLLSHLEAAGGSYLGLFPGTRAVDTLRGQKASGQSQFGVLAKRANIAAEPLQALEAKLKGSMGSQIVRSLVIPGLPQDIKLQRDQTKLSRILGELSENSKSNQAKSSDRNKVIEMQKAGEKAGKELEGLYKKYGLSKVAKRDEELYNYAHPYPGSTEGGIYGKKEATESIYAPQSSSSSIYQTTPTKPKIPHETNGISLGSINIPGLGKTLGAIGTPLASLISGEKAQAAGLPKAKPVTLKGPLTTSQKSFGTELVKQTHLTPKTVGGWLLAEESGSAAAGKQSSGDNNLLNIGPGAVLSSNPKMAARETAALINTSSYYAGIRSTVGKGTAAQVNAIKASPWDAGHYANGIPTNLVQGSASNVLLKGDVRPGQGGTVRVRADAKGMVKWAHALVGTQEGSRLQQKWAAQAGVSSSEPWCSEFIAAGLQRRGLPQPSNPAYSGTWLTWSGGKHIGTNITKAKPGDILVFGSNPGSTSHVGLYVGSGKMISGNWSNEVAAAKVSEESEPIAGIVRPKYKGGMVSVKAGTPLPGSALGPTGSPIAAPAVAVPVSDTTSAPKAGKQKQKQSRQRMSAAQRLKLVEQITSGNLTRFGIPGMASPNRAPVSSLAALGKSLEAGRQELAQL
jgi:hypothetical protein